jgi:hypothetical protein
MAYPDVCPAVPVATPVAGALCVCGCDVAVFPAGTEVPDAAAAAAVACAGVAPFIIAFTYAAYPASPIAATPDAYVFVTGLLGAVYVGVGVGVGVVPVVVFGAVVVAVDCGAFCATPLASAACVCCVVSFGVVVVVAATRASVAALFCATSVGFSQYLYTSAIL